MADSAAPGSNCTSVFKSGGSTTTKSEFTQKWIELIQKEEKRKGITAVRRL